jgi:endoglucanase
MAAEILTDKCEETRSRIRRAGVFLFLSSLFFQAMCMTTPALHTDGKYFKDPAGNIVILRGVDLGDLAMMNTQRGSMSVFKMIDTLTNESHGWYARIIRLCISPGAWLGNPDSYYNSHLKPAVDYCVSKSVYCIIDWHYVADPAPNANSTVQFWTYVAPKFKTYANVLYEIYNENSSTSMTWDQWKTTYAQPWVNLIRQQAPDNIVLVGGPSWSQHIGGSATNPVTGKNIAYVGHIYPQNPTSLWSANGEITVAAKSSPVMMTEWGYLQGAAVPCSGTQTSFGNPFKAWVESTGVSWTAWCADDVWDPKMFNSDWSLRTGDAQMGGFVKDWLNQKRNNDLPNGSVRMIRSAAPASFSPIINQKRGALNIEGCGAKAWALRVMSPDGRTLLCQTNGSGGFIVPIDRFAQGVYLLHLYNGTSELHERLIRVRP